MVEYGTTKAGKEDAISNVKGEIDNVRGIMSQNIENLLERGERIDLLVDKTDRLGGRAHEFRVRSRGLRRQMWYVSQLFLFEKDVLLTNCVGGRTSNSWLS
jgi:vesicle-associated membrane protein 7